MFLCFLISKKKRFFCIFFSLNLGAQKLIHFCGKMTSDVKEPLSARNFALFLTFAIQRKKKSI